MVVVLPEEPVIPMTTRESIPAMTASASAAKASCTSGTTIVGAPATGRLVSEATAPASIAAGM